MTDLHHHQEEGVHEVHHQTCDVEDRRVHGVVFMVLWRLGLGTWETGGVHLLQTHIGRGLDRLAELFLGPL